MKKLFALIPQSQKKSPVRYYRGEGVLEMLPVQVEYIEQELDWVEWMRIAKSEENPVLYVMRSVEPGHLDAAVRAQRNGIKIWYDLDDDFTAVDKDNLAYDTISQPIVQQTFGAFLRIADMVTVSTEQIKNKFLPFRDGKPIIVIPNAIDDRYFKEILNDELPTPTRNMITWRGGGSHFLDLEDFSNSLGKFLNENPTWNMAFMGFRPWWLEKDFPKQVKYLRYNPDFYSWLPWFRNQAPWAHVVPLRDTPFNRAKSCIAALEALYAGSLPIVPEFEEWAIPGCLTYKDEAELERMLHLVSIMDVDRREAKIKEGLKWVRENRLLSNVNKLREGLL